MSNGFKGSTLKRKNVKGLALSAPQPKSSAPSAGDAQIPGAIGNDSDRPDTLEIGVEFKLDLRSEDLIVLKELGAGNGGTVSKVVHAATRVVMAKKVIHVEAKTAVRKQIVRELHIMHDCSSPNIVSFYGAFLNDSGDVIMCMEYMDCGSLDRISKDFGPVRVDVLGKIAEAILGGLNYLYEVHRIMHRDIKPSNVLVNSRGYIKLCDFGVSGELVNSIANTFVGTSTYMAPERIQGGAYSVKSDVWSVGLTLMELAIGRFPFDASDAAAGDRASAGPMGILDLLQQIVHEPAPKLPQSDAFPPILDQMIQKCLLKQPDERPTPRELYDKDHFLQAAKRTPVNLEEWAVNMLVRHNRKSHLAPQLSPSTQALLRDGSSSTTSNSSNSKDSKTPTSAEIPIGSEDLKASPPPLPMSVRQNINQQQLQDPLYARPATAELASSYDPSDLNGSGNIQQYPESRHTRPSYPPRTSSSSAVSDHSRGGGSFGVTTTLPIRPAPPPSGPLPTPPSSSLGGRSQQHVSSRRQGMAGLPYVNVDTPQY
ncbi:MAG: MAP kinase kinase (MEK) [Pleopsidium flavum]|nr:MAG: MAP kinase kinase (MEK) [Pleopsidium flavum]